MKSQNACQSLLINLMLFNIIFCVKIKTNSQLLTNLCRTYRMELIRIIIVNIYVMIFRTLFCIISRFVERRKHICMKIWWCLVLNINMLSCNLTWLVFTQKNIVMNSFFIIVVFRSLLDIFQVKFCDKLKISFRW